MYWKLLEVIFELKAFECTRYKNYNKAQQSSTTPAKLRGFPKSAKNIEESGSVPLSETRKPRFFFKGAWEIKQMKLKDSRYRQTAGPDTESCSAANKSSDYQNSSRSKAWAGVVAFTKTTTKKNRSWRAGAGLIAPRPEAFHWASMNEAWRYFA